MEGAAKTPPQATVRIVDLKASESINAVLWPNMWFTDGTVGKRSYSLPKCRFLSISLVLAFRLRVGGNRSQHESNEFAKCETRHSGGLTSEPSPLPGS